jgi:hypothetical protein
LVIHRLQPNLDRSGGERKAEVGESY